MTRARQSQRNLAVGFSISAVVAFQLSTALSPPLFGRLGPSGVAALRLAVAAAILFAVVRPPLHARRELIAPICLGLTTGVEFVIWFEAVARVPLGAVVAIGFVGPLAVAVSDSRRLLDGLWAALAAGGILLLTLGHPAARSLNVTGLALAFGCAGLWATYILLTKRVGERWARFQGLAGSAAIALIVCASAGVTLTARDETPSVPLID